MKLEIVFSVLLIGIFLLCVASAKVPRMINYQGKLTDPDGALISDTVSMVFIIYDDSSDGTALWTETQDSMIVQNGIFSSLLGSVNPIPDSVFDGSVRYLGIKVGADSEMTPRKAIVSVGYAYKAEYADTAEYAQVAVSDGDWEPDTSGFNIYRLTGNVGIGTTNPQGKLDLNGPLAVEGDVGDSGQVLTSQGPSNNPTWAGIHASGISNVAIGIFSTPSDPRTGTVSVTGLGFQPKVVLLMSCLEGSTAGISWGWDDATSHGCMSRDMNGRWQSSNTLSYFVHSGLSAGQHGYLSSMDTDGFTIYYINDSSAGLGLNMTYLAIK